jgi:hypothetical protein
MGKVEVKDLAKWANELKSKLGMVTGIRFSKDRPFSYAKDPQFWRDCLIGALGYDKRRISSDYICINKPEVKGGQAEVFYNLYLYSVLVDQCELSNNDLNTSLTNGVNGESI